VTPCNWINVSQRFGRSLIIVLVVRHRCKENSNFACGKIDLNLCITTRECMQTLYLYLEDWVTVHRSITLVDLQLDAQNSYLFTYNAFIKILYMFRALPCSSSGGLRRNCIYAASGVVTVCRRLSCAPVEKELFPNWCTGQSPAESDDTSTITVRCSTITVRCSAITVRCSPITVRCSTITVRCSSITVRCSQLQ
jgi:hypothetical protein